MQIKNIKLSLIILGMLVMLFTNTHTPCTAKENPVHPAQRYEYVNIDFWSRFSDAYLCNYILMAIENNHDAKKASWQVEQYRQEVKKAFGKELPSLSVGANYVGVHVPSIVPNTSNNNIFAMPFILNWELDLLQKNRDKTRSAKRTYMAYGYDEQATYLTLATDVGTAYINLLQYDYMIMLQEKYVESAAQIMARNDRKFRSGTLDAQSYNTYRQDFEDAKNSLGDWLKQREQVRTQLALLVGLPPSAEIKRGTLREFEYAHHIPEEISSDVVFSRPDVMAAEARLQGAQIDVRVARKELFPSFNILGVLAFSTFVPANFWSWESTVAFLLAGATQDLFKGGQRIAQLKMRKSMYEQMFEDYKQKDLNALKEVNDALYIVKQDEIIDKNTIKKIAIEQDSYRRSQNKFSNGIISQPELISEYQKILSVQQKQAQSKTARLINYLTLYKAVGGDL